MKEKTINKLIQLSIIIYLAIMLFSELNEAYFNKYWIVPTNTTTVYKIAIIDISFNLEEFDKDKILNPYNVETETRTMQKLPQFDYFGKLSLNNHGTDIINLFIGKNGFLKNAQIIPIQISDPLKLDKAINYAIAQQADIISISLGFAPEYRAMPTKLQNVLLNIPIPTLIAAGNEGTILESTEYGKSLIQLVKNNSNIKLVGSFKQTLLGKKISSFSNRSNIPNIILFAPGEHIKTGNFFENLFTQGVSGTSIATPLLAIKLINIAQKRHISIKKALEILSINS